MAKKFILDEFNNKIEVTDEVGNTTVNEIKCCESGTPFKMAFVTQAKFNELEAEGLLKPNTIYEITDDTTLEVINETLEKQETTLEEINKTLTEHTSTLNSHAESINEIPTKYIAKTKITYANGVLTINLD